MSIIAESHVEEAALAWLSALGFAVAGGLDIGPDGTTPERASDGAVVLDGQLRAAMPSSLCTGGEQREAEAHPLSVADTDARCQATSIAKSLSASPHRIGQGVAVQQAGYHRAKQCRCRAESEKGQQREAPTVRLSPCRLVDDAPAAASPASRGGRVYGDIRGGA